MDVVTGFTREQERWADRLWLHREVHKLPLAEAFELTVTEALLVPHRFADPQPEPVWRD